MTKDPSRPELWKIGEVEDSPAEYIAAQQAAKERIEREAREQREADDRANFVRAFVEQGGRKSEGESEWRKRRDARAAITAEQVEVQAEEQTKTRIRSGL